VGGARVSVHIPRQYRDDLERLAREKGVSLGELVRQAISELLTRAREGSLVVENDEGEPLHKRVAEAVAELVSRVDKPGVIPRDDVSAFLTRHGLTGRNERIIFRQVLRHELAMRGFRLIVLSSGALVITRLEPTPS
jgi:Arc/MetJ-type ribon-helix-helix transcriptional regulator